jgi:hypothetical protein
LDLSWSLFEALVATIYEQEAERVILTPGSADHGCDVVVLGWGERRENILIQCKSTSRDKLDGDSAIRELQGALPFYENATGAIFHHCMLHTTAKKFSKRTMQAAKLCHVTIHGRSWLAEMMDKMKIDKALVLARETRRERII